MTAQARGRQESGVSAAAAEYAPQEQRKAAGRTHSKRAHQAVLGALAAVRAPKIKNPREADRAEIAI